MLLIANGTSLTGSYFEHTPYPPEPAALGKQVTIAEDPLLASAADELREYLAGERREFTVPLSTAGDEFSERVWKLLREIPYGQTRSYGELAETLGTRALAQRVGQAVGRNPLMVFIPCHRVLGADGSLTGYAGGLNRKRTLLALEEPPAATAGRLF